jgi:GNAT superfamily N-acetyltransferase
MTDFPRTHRVVPDEEILFPGSSVRPKRQDAVLEDELHALDKDIGAARRTLRRTAAGGLGLFAHRVPAAPRPHGERVRLSGGAEVLIRPIEADDAAELGASFEHLGALSRYRRFLAPVEHLSRRQLEYLTHVDHRTHEALVAQDPSTGEGAGVARYVRSPTDRRQAELVFTVADGWQGRGLATALLERLAERARSNGVEFFTIRMLVGNEGARRSLDHVADVVAERREGGTLDLKARLRA